MPNEQSDFNLEQEVLSPPPEVLAAEAQAKIVHKANPNLWLIKLVLGLSAVLFLLIIIYISANRPNKPVLTITGPTPTPGREIPLTKLQLQLQQLETVVSDADPQKDNFPPPEIDMQVKF